MKDMSRIKVNPVTKEIEIEGSEEFVKGYFYKILAMISGAPRGIAKEPKVVKASPAKKAPKEPKAVKARPPKKARKDKRKKPGVKKITNTGTVVTLIKGSAEGISTAELTEKTGLAKEQIWYIVNRAVKQGKIRKVKQGVYCAA
jgi:hypothetical protein